VHPPLGKSSAEAIGSRAKARVQPFIEDILSGKRRWHGLVGLLFGLVLLPVSILYLLVGRFNLAKLFYASAACTGCGVCAKSCPARAVQMWGKKKPRPYWTFACESCMRCMNVCPEKAVEVSHPLAVGLCFLMAFPAAICALNWLSVHCTMSMRPDSLWLRIPLQYVYILMSIWVAHIAFHLLMRASLVNRAVTMLTLTRYWGRYRELGTDAKELTGGTKGLS
jgi:ferredoxin